MLTKEAGLYAARIIDPESPNKPLAIVGPSNMQMNKSTNEFVITIPGPLEDVFYAEPRRILELYVRRKQIDAIKYGQPSNERIQVQHLEGALRLPMELLPDPRTVIEDAADQEK